ncbi:MAG: TIGR03936 family radical SAM-associated protein [Xanthomonadaceae bacterium]|nr:TIGR03936 family radical SAM-associated protein [Xanthomonadaceae bacterium]
MSEINYKNVRIKFEKTGTMKYISHLDLNRLFSRSFARAGIEIAHSEGFNPHPKITFVSALSLGVESFCEFVDIKVTGDISARTVFQRVPGFAVFSVSIIHGDGNDSQRARE